MTNCYYCELNELEAVDAFRTVTVRFCGTRAAVQVCKDKADCETRCGKRVNVA
jgi:hypothetical protein